MYKKIFATVLVLAILSSLTGHIFLHLADEPFHQESSHQISAHHEDAAAQNQNHQCSICLDHQALSLDLPVSIFDVDFSQQTLVSTDVVAYYEARKILLAADRGPPRI